MHCEPQTGAVQPRVQTCTEQPDSDAFFDLLTGPRLLDGAAALSPEHRSRLFPDVKVLSMFCNRVLSAERSCQRAVDAEALRRLAQDLPSHFLLCALAADGIDGVFEQLGARRHTTSFSLGQQLGARDRLLVLHRPERPDWMDPANYAAVPATLTVRELTAGARSWSRPCGARTATRSRRSPPSTSGAGTSSSIR